MASLLAKPCKDDKQIEKDIRRTILPPMAEGKTKERYYETIRRVLLAYSVYNPAVGYVQGMNIIVSCLLFNLCCGDFERVAELEGDAFALFFALMERYQIGGCYTNNMKRIFELSKDLEEILRRNLPALYEHINHEEASSSVLHLRLLRQPLLLLRPAHHAHRADQSRARPRLPLWSNQTASTCCSWCSS